MRFAFIVILACGLALAQANSWQDNGADSLESTSKHDHHHSDNWPCETADYPEAQMVIRKVNHRLEDIDDEQLKERVIEYVSNQLKHCKSDGSMDKHCANRCIGYAMSFIHNQLKKQNKF